MVVYDPSTVAVLAAPVFAADSAVGAAFVFGSVARGRATDASDVDIGVVGEAVDTLCLAAALTSLLRHEVDVVELRLDSPIPLLRAVLRDGRRIYERAPGVAASFASHARSVVDLDGPGYDRMVRAFLARVARQGVGP